MTEGFDEPLQTNAADEAQVAHADRTTKERERRASALLRQQLSTRDGREFVWELLRELGVFSDAYGSHEAVYRFLGRRAAGTKLLQRCVRFPQLWLEMQAEAMKRDEDALQQNKAARTKRASS